MTSSIKLLDAEPVFVDGPKGLVVKKEQLITDRFLQHTADMRHASSSARAGEFHEVAAIPTVVVEQWLREGFDITAKGVTAHEIVTRLRRDNLTAFLTTNKRV